MTFDALRNIVKQSIIDMPFNPGLQINTFHHLDGPPDLETSNFGASYKDYQSGRFWSRDWVVSGAEPNKLAGKWPYCGFEPGVLNTTDLQDGELDTYFDLLVVDILDCPDCPESMFRSDFMISTTTRQMLRMLLAEMSTYKLYQWLNDEDEDVYEWISQGRFDSLPGTDPRKLTGRPIEFFFVGEGMDNVKITPWGLTVGRRGHWARVPIKICEPVMVPFNYNHPAAPELATTICPC